VAQGRYPSATAGDTFWRGVRALPAAHWARIPHEFRILNSEFRISRLFHVSRHSSSDRRHKPAPHQVDHHRPKSRFDDVRAKSPQHAAVAAPGLCDGRDNCLEIGGRQDVGKRLNELGDRRRAIRRTGKIRRGDFALARLQRVRFDAGDVKLLVRKNHGGSQF